MKTAGDAGSTPCDHRRSLVSYQNPQIGLGLVSLKYGGRSGKRDPDGSTTAISHSTNFEVQEGRIWSDAEESRGARVVMLGHDSAETLFPNESPLARILNARAESSRWSASSRRNWNLRQRQEPGR